MKRIMYVFTVIALGSLGSLQAHWKSFTVRNGTGWVLEAQVQPIGSCKASDWRKINPGETIHIDIDDNKVLCRCLGKINIRNVQVDFSAKNLTQGQDLTTAGCYDTAKWKIEAVRYQSAEQYGSSNYATIVSMDN